MQDAPNIHKIVEPYIALVVDDEITYSCYGTAPTKHEPPEVIQITLFDSDIDLSFKLSGTTIKSIQAAAERMWLDGAFDNNEFYKSLNKD